MNPRLAVLALAGLAAAAAASAKEAPPIQPGYWESTNRVLSPITTTSVERRCITPADVDKFMAGPSNRHYACTYPTRTIAGGHIRLKGTCVSKRGRQIAVEGQGTYTPSSFQIQAQIAVDFLGLPVSGQASTEAKRIGDVCPAQPEPAQPDPALPASGG